MTKRQKILWYNRKNAYILENSDEIYGINSRQNLATATKIMNNRKLADLMDNGVTIVDPSATWISEDTEIPPKRKNNKFDFVEIKDFIKKA